MCREDTTANSSKILIGSLQDFTNPKTIIKNPFKPGRILIVNKDDNLYGICNVCPHQGGPLSSGSIIDIEEVYTEQHVGHAAESAAKSAATKSTAEITTANTSNTTTNTTTAETASRIGIECPIHSWQFDIQSGKCLSNSFVLDTFDVVVEEDNVYITGISNENVVGNRRDFMGNEKVKSSFGWI
jgi:nitrite reductase/ring-hydroxylating ferredoxin subunit